MSQQLLAEEISMVIPWDDPAVQLILDEESPAKVAPSLRQRSRELRARSETLRSRNVDVMKRATDVTSQYYELFLAAL